MKSIQPLLCFLLFCACSSTSELPPNAEDLPNDEPISNSLYFPPNTSNEWETVRAETLGWNTEAIENLDQFLDDSGTKAFIILYNGRIVKETYYNGAVASDNLPWFSAGKTLTAFSTLQARNDNYISLTDSTSDYLGLGWTSMTEAQETAITIANQLKMTSGGDYTVNNIGCTEPECLQYLNVPDTEWYYHNAFYTLIQPVLDEAIPQGFDNYFNIELRSRIGMNGTWLQVGNVRPYFSTARSMARFGLLNLNRGTWQDDELLSAGDFIEMTSTSQQINLAYGYLWWLNGKDNFRLPGSTNTYQGSLIPNAPNDLIAGLGANDQKLHIVPSEKLVIVRMGDDAGMGLAGPSSFDSMLWEKLNAILN